MDNLTHSLFGALLGQLGLKRKTGLAMPALIIGANLPDVDAACFFWLDGIEHLGFRRGITHGPPAMVILPLLLAGILWWFDRWQAKRGSRPESRIPVHFGWLFGLSFLACLTHPALDWLNVYGVRLLEPFSSQWFYGDTLFIIDVWLIAVLALGIWFSLRWEKQMRKWQAPALTAFLVTLAYIGANLVWSIHQRDRLDSELPVLECLQGDCEWTVIASPVPFFPWQREMIVNLPPAWRIAVAGRDNGFASLRPVSSQVCEWPGPTQMPKGNSQLEAFLFWTRAPFAERAPDGSVILRDARFYDPRARDRFSVYLPDVKCQPIRQSDG